MPGEGTRGRGRPKGSPNKTTAAIKQAFLDAFDKAGGVPALVKWGEANRTAFYKAIVTLLPKEIDASVSGRVVVELVEQITDPPGGPPDDQTPPGPS